jgi:DNA (cytosine-5)-methyltransferase 1
MNYYNEYDAGAAAWLRELINQTLIPYGHVDTRSITEVKPDELKSYAQCHFFGFDFGD